MIGAKPECGSLKSAALAGLWIALVLTVAFAVPLPNNHWSNGAPMSRWQLALEFVDPPAEKPAKGGAGAASSSWESLPQRIDLIAVAAVILAGAWGTGHLVLRVLRPRFAARCLERTVFAYGVGLASLSLATLGAGLAGALSRPLLGGLMAASVIVELSLRLTSPKSEIRNPNSQIAPDATPPAPPCEGGEMPRDSEFRIPNSEFPARLARSDWLLLACALPFVWFMLLGALLPSVDFDVNEYHFEGPKEFFQAGRISRLEHNVYTSFPFGTEMLTLLAMVLRNDWYQGALAGKAVLMTFAPLTAMLLFVAGRRWFGTAAGVFAAVLYLSTPWVFRISTIAYAEGGLTFYLFASLVAVMIAVDTTPSSTSPSPLVGEGRGGGASGNSVPTPTLTLPHQGGGNFPSLPGRELVAPSKVAGEHLALSHSGTTSLRQLLLAGLLAGSAMACKYPGLVSVVIPLGLAVCVVAWTWRGRSPACWKLPLAFAMGVVLAVGPWLLKNAVETGNPVYPLAYRVFGGRDWDEAVEARWHKAHSPGTYSLSSLADLALDVAARNDWVNPLLFAFAPLALLAAATRRKARALWLYVGWLFLTCWLLTHRIDRFWVPLLPVLALLAGAGASWLQASLPRGVSRSALLFPLALVGLFHLKFITTPLCGYNDFFADLGAAERIAAQLTTPELAWLSETLPPGSKVLSVGDAAVFAARVPVVYNTVFDRSLLEEWCAAHPGEASTELREPAAIRKKFADEGITHVYVCWREILRYRSPGNYGYTAFVVPGRFAELQRLGILGPVLAVPGGLRDLDELDPEWRTELETWGQALITGAGRNQAYRTYEVFPVRRIEK